MYTHMTKRSIEHLHNVPIVSGATTVDLEDGSSIIVIVNEAFYYGNRLNHSLLNLNQIRYSSIQFWDNPSDQEH